LDPKDAQSGRRGAIAWVRLDEKRSLNAKLRKAGLAARGLDEAAICWTAHQEHDGHISRADVEMLASLHGCRKLQPLVDALVEVGRWEEMKDLEGQVTAYNIKDFLDFNPSRAELEDQRKKDRERKRKSAAASGRNPPGGDGDA
jgi:hypothetical protein